jgi:hypothetical protein
MVSLNRISRFLSSAGCGRTSGVLFVYRVSQEEYVRLWEGVPYFKVYRYYPKHLYPTLNGSGDIGQRNLKL